MRNNYRRYLTIVSTLATGDVREVSPFKDKQLISISCGRHTNFTNFTKYLILKKENKYLKVSANVHVQLI